MRPQKTRMKIKTIKLLFITACILTSVPYAQAQKKKDKKDKKSKELAITRLADGDNISLEMDMDDSDGEYKTLTMGNQGMVLYYNKKDEKKGDNRYEFIKFNTELEEEYRKEYILPKGESILSIKEAEGNIYLVVAPKKSKSTSLYGTYIDKYTLVRFDPLKQEFTSFPGRLAKGGYFVSIRVVKDVAYLNFTMGPSPGKIQGQLCLNVCTCFIPMLTGLTKITFKSELVIHDLQTKKQKEINLGYDKRKGNVMISDVSIDEETGEATMLMSNAHKKLYALWFKTMDKTGKLGKDINVRVPNNKTLGSVRITTTEGKRVFFGTYNEIPKRVTFGRTASPTLSQGVSFGIVGESAVEKINLLAYNKIKGFKFPTTSREAKQIKRKSKKGKEASINLMVHFLEPLLYNDEIISVGEVYYATYRTEVYVEYVNGKPVTKTRQVFDGWAFCNILFLSINLKGELLWSNAIPYTRPKSFFIYDRVKPTLQEDGSIRVVYSNGTHVVTSLVNGSEVIAGKRYSITGIKSGDKVKAAATSGDGADINYWYDDYYLASGRHVIKNKKLKGKEKKRDVYYIKRIELVEE